MWSVDYSRIEDWLDMQDESTVARIFAALELLEAEGPALGRPLVGSISGSKVANLKELRPSSPGHSEIRILFAFNPQRKAILLVAGDKSRGKRGRAPWTRWYKSAIAEAEELFAIHLNQLGESNA